MRNRPTEARRTNSWFSSLLKTVSKHRPSCENRGLNPGLKPYFIFGIVVLACFVVRHLLIGLLRKQVTGQTTFPALFLRSVRIPSILWCVVIAIAVAIHNATLTPQQLYWAEKSIAAFAIISMSLVIASATVGTIRVYGTRYSLHFAVAGLSRTLTYALILSIGGLMLLRLFNITITPLLTALGVGGLAVALALQDTLANLFAGIHILVEEAITVGDSMRLSSGEEGIVKDISWRTTRILTGANNIIVIPNTKIATGILTNFSMPDKRVVVDIPILVALEADPHKVAEIAIAVAKSTEGVLPDAPPSVLFDPGITPTHMQLKLIFQTASYGGRGGVASAIRVAMLDRFRAADVPLLTGEKIVITKP